MSRPDFIIAGVQKSATTSLHEHLDQHDHVSMSRPKELHFFDTPRRPSESAVRAYRERFPSYPHTLVTGESTPIYSYYPGALELIRDVLGPIKVVIIVRHPVQRTYSHYQHEVRIGWEQLSYQQALRRTPSCPDDDVYLRHHSYIERSCYTDQLERCRALFGDDEVLVVRFEDFVASPLQTVNTVLTFIDPSLAHFAHLEAHNSSRSGAPRIVFIHRAVAGLHQRLGRRVFPPRTLGWNLTGQKYPPLGGHEYDVTRQILLERDSELLNLYPDL